jgi:hypothetical protein
LYPGETEKRDIGTWSVGKSVPDGWLAAPFTGCTLNLKIPLLSSKHFSKEQVICPMGITMKKH